MGICPHDGLLDPAVLEREVGRLVRLPHRLIRISVTHSIPNFDLDSMALCKTIWTPGPATNGWRTGTTETGRTSAYSPLTNMMYMPWWASSAETGTTAWTYEQRAATESLAITAAGLVFVGKVNDRFRGLNDETGEVLWEVVPTSFVAFSTPSVRTASPEPSSRAPARHEDALAVGRVDRSPHARGSDRRTRHRAG